MKPNFELPSAPTSLGGVATDLHDNVAKLPAHVQTGDDPLASLFKAGQRIECKRGLKAALLDRPGMSTIC